MSYRVAATVISKRDVKCCIVGTYYTDSAWHAEYMHFDKLTDAGHQVLDMSISVIREDGGVS